MLLPKSVRGVSRGPSAGAGPRGQSEVGDSLPGRIAPQNCPCGPNSYGVGGMACMLGSWHMCVNNQWLDVGGPCSVPC